MRRGTTPTHTFHTDYDCTGAEVIDITYKQHGEIILNINDLERMTVEPEEISVKLTQAETLSFFANQGVEVQIRVRMASGDALASNKMLASVEDVLKDGEI